MHFSIRRGTLEDAETISKLVTECARRFIGPTLSHDGLENLLMNMCCDSTRDRILRGWPHFCAFAGMQLAGVATLKPPGHLYHLFVGDEFQDRGLGTKLFLVADALPNGIKTVNSSLNAVEFYRRLDFLPQGKAVEQNGVCYQPMSRRVL